MSGANYNASSEHDKLLLALVHDIRSHLRKSVTSTQALEKELSASLTPEAKALIGKIVQAGHNINQLLSRLTQYAVAGSNGEGEASGEVSVMFAAALRRLSAKNVDAEIDGTAFSSSGLKAPYGIEIVFVELLDNALKFRAGPVRITALIESRDGQTIFGVNDTGIGFDPQYTDKIFEPFEKLHPADLYPGVGLGLPICKRIVECHGGTLWATSSVGGGATFSFSLPS